MTVKELQKVLADLIELYPSVADMHVQLEGCDCWGELVGAEVVHNGGTSELLLQRYS